VQRPIRHAGHVADKKRTPPLQSPSDLAVDGLLRGLAGGIAMLLVLVGAGALAGLHPMHILASFGIESSVQPLHGLLAHLAVSAVYGVLWGFGAGYALRRTLIPYWVWGATFGALLYAIAAAVLLPMSPLAQIPWGILLAAHLVYGAVVGLLHRPAPQTVVPAASHLRP
jgi:hypothetical protein